MSQSTCPVCGEPLQETERSTIEMSDFEQQTLERALRPLRESERARILANGVLGEWRSVACPAHPDAVGFLAERLPDREREEARR